jgi:hypothetical protein
LSISYIISTRFDYNQIIAADGGKAFADDYGWQTSTLANLRDTRCDIAIIDQRIQEEEISELRSAIYEGQNVFVLRLCDPYWNARDHWWYRFVAEMLDHPRCHIMLNYQPAEITALFATRARRSQFLYAPYVYRPEKEQSIDHENRLQALIISGARNRDIYPLRARIMQAAAFWPWLRASSKILAHPGYPDLAGDKLFHHAIGDAYIKYLAAFKFAAVCSSRCRLEFLKYREFAYAGVVPVGDMPASLLDCPFDAWVPWRRNFIDLTHKIRTLSDTASRAQSFRKFMRARRHVDDMRKWVSEQLARLS